VIDYGSIHLQRDDIFCPILHADIGYLGARSDDEIIHAAGKAGGALIA
jgi:hypothetical protein